VRVFIPPKQNNGGMKPSQETLKKSTCRDRNYCVIVFSTVILIHFTTGFLTFLYEGVVCVFLKNYAACVNIYLGLRNF